MQYPPGPPQGPPPYGGPPGSPQGFGPPGYGPPPAPGGFTPPPMMMAPGMPGAPYGIHPTLGIPYSEKQKILAAILQLLVGFGVGRLYIGHTNLGIAQLVACVAGFFLAFFTCGITAFVFLWTFVDGILLLVGNDIRDGQGYPLR